MRRLYEFVFLFKEYLVVGVLLAVSVTLLALNDDSQIRTIRSVAVVSVGMLQDALGIIPNYFDLRRENQVLRELNLTLADEVKIFSAMEVDFRGALRWLGTKWGVNRLLCEGGGELNDALFRAALVDEIHLTICPKIFGGRLAPTMADGLGFEQLAGAARFELTSKKRKKAELFTVFSRR